MQNNVLYFTNLRFKNMRENTLRKELQRNNTYYINQTTLSLVGFVKGDKVELFKESDKGASYFKRVSDGEIRRVPKRYLQRKVA